MSQVKKYDPFGYDGLSALMTECEHGDYVRHEDYAALEAELAKLEAGMPRLMQANYDLRQQRDAALAECEQLREALQKIAAIKNRYNCGDWDEIEDARNIADSALSAKPTEG